MAREFEGPTEGMRRDVKKMQTMSARLQNIKAGESYAGDEADTGAFNAMQDVTKSKASNLFRESQYNTSASKKERKAYDKKALDALIGMWQSDRDKNQFKGIDFDRYVELLRPSLFEERVLSREGDQKLGDFFIDIYEGDVDQFKASAMRAPMPGPTDE